jgi:hypothetical protein
MIDVAVYQLPSHRRSRVITEAMLKGIAAAGDRPRQRWANQYRGPEAPVGVLYGLEGLAPRIFRDHQRAGGLVFVDLGYWGRREGGRWTGYHKVVVNERHPTAYFQRRPHDFDRAARLELKAQPWRSSGRHVLLCGMSDKGAQACGFAPEQWERETIARLLKATDRPIVYRPKPSWYGSRPLPGAGYSPREETFEQALADAWCVVSHHSNCNVDGLLAGVPSFCVEGVAAPLSETDLTKIETPRRPGGREQWIADLAYTQWTVDEIAQGKAWRHLKDEGLLCG